MLAPAPALKLPETGCEPELELRAHLSSNVSRPYRLCLFSNGFEATRNLSRAELMDLQDAINTELAKVGETTHG